ncbi:hypothetical protein RJ639_020857, partial [Escallonia herrerae]
VKEASYTRLCKSKKILTVNGKFPGPTLYAYKGDTIIVNVHNRANQNITIHWYVALTFLEFGVRNPSNFRHGVKLPRYPWSDGPEYVTQCPIQPGHSFRQKVIFSSEEGTLWWHAHSDWSRATVHGAIVVYPKNGTAYPFPKPDAEVPIILGEWWKKDADEVLQLMLATGGDPNISDAFTINGQPGDFYPCSKAGTFKLNVDHGKTYLLRMVNADMNEIMFYKIAKHKLTVVGADASYTKPLKSKYVVLSPGQTLDCLLHANSRPDSYYMAARAYSSGIGVPFDNTTTTAILQYNLNYDPSSLPIRPSLPYYNDTTSAFRFIGQLKSLNSDDYPDSVPLNVTRMVTTISVNTFPCVSATNASCEGPNVTRLAASMNNISFANPDIAILQAYYKHIKGAYGTNFPSYPPLVFNFTADYMPLELEVPRLGTEVKVLKYNTSMEVVIQGTNLLAGIDHPMHLHGNSFYVVGYGFGNFDEKKDPLAYNLKDPPLRNTAAVPKNGWIAIRFRANNPGVWFMHCHLERHLTWGMDTVFIVKNGECPDESILPPPPDMPEC